MTAPADVAESGEPDRGASEEHPQYHKSPQDSGATQMWMICVDEGWRTWILCTDMYEWAADDLLRRLRATDERWPH